MDLEYFPFDVSGFLQAKRQPVFLLKSLDPSLRYWVPDSLDPISFVTAVAPSEGVRIPVFAVVAEVNNDELSQASVLFGLGLENALRIVKELSVQQQIFPNDIVSATVVLSTDCHFSSKKCRAYFGLALGVSSAD